MKQKAISLAISLRDRLFQLFLLGVGLFIGLALITQIFFVVLQFSGKEEYMQHLANEFSWRFDGTFKNSPGNIWYNASEHIYVEKVTNKVVIGKLAGNRNLEFGVKNILEEYIQEKYDGSVFDSIRTVQSFSLD